MIKKLSERKGLNATFNSLEMSEFKAFIEEMELTDLATIGSKFSWFSVSGSSISRLDCFLMSNSRLLSHV